MGIIGLAFRVPRLLGPWVLGSGTSKCKYRSRRGLDNSELGFGLLFSDN